MTIAAERLSALLANVLAHPADTDRRLVYADALSDAGQDDRADLIRVQCAAADTVKGYDVRHPLRVRERQLLEGDIWSWMWGVRWPTDWRVKVVGPAGNVSVHGNGVTVYPMVVFRRGFIEQLELPAEGWLAVADDVLTRHPVRKVRLLTWPKLCAHETGLGGMWCLDAGNGKVLWFDRGVDRRYITKALLGDAWPYIEYE